MASFTLLEPMSTGDVIDRSVRIYRRNFSVLIRVAAIPCLIGYLASLMFWFGYSRLFNEVAMTGSSDIPGLALLFVLLGGIGYLAWVLVLLSTFAGLSRAVGDHLMLDEPITFRRFFSAIRGRIGNILMMALLLFAVIFVVYILFSILILALITIVGLIVGLTAAAGMPPWVLAVSIAIIVIVGVAAAIIALLFTIARVIFLPQVVMIEGQSPGQALSRAIKLGAGNWWRVGAIILFAYFVELSMLAALTLPVLAILYMVGLVDSQFLVSPGWNILYAAFSQIAYLLTLPIWIVSFTLLYFDSRVRKEAYDIELLAREVSPGFVWQPIVQPAPFGYQLPVSSTGRVYVQTSPLGLAGYDPRRSGSPVTMPQTVPEGSAMPPQMPPSAVHSSQPQPTPREHGVDLSEPTPVGDGTSSGAINSVLQPPPANAIHGAGNCNRCGEGLLPGALFCTRCGSAVV